MVTVWQHAVYHFKHCCLLVWLYWIRKTHKVNILQHPECLKREGDTLFSLWHFKSNFLLFDTDFPLNNPWILGTHIQRHSGKHTDTYKRPATFYSLSFHFPAFTGMLRTAGFRKQSNFFSLICFFGSIEQQIQASRGALTPYLVISLLVYPSQEMMFVAFSHLHSASGVCVSLFICFSNKSLSLRALM